MDEQTEQKTDAKEINEFTQGSSTSAHPRSRARVVDLQVLDPEHDYKGVGRFPALQAKVIEELSGAYARCEEAASELVANAKRRAEIMESWARQTEEQVADMEAFRKKQGN